MIRFSSIKTSKNQKWAKNEFDNLLKLSYFMDLHGDYKGSEKTYNIANSISKFIKIAQPDDFTFDTETYSEDEKNETEDPETKFTPNTEPITEETIQQISDKTFLEQGLKPSGLILQHRTQQIDPKEVFERSDLLEKTTQALSQGGMDIKRSLENLKPIVEEAKSNWRYADYFRSVLKVALTRYYNNPFFMREQFDLPSTDYKELFEGIYHGNITDNIVNSIKYLITRKNKAEKEFQGLYNYISSILVENNYEPNQRLIHIIMKTSSIGSHRLEDEIKEKTDTLIAGMEFTDNDVLVMSVGNLVKDTSREFVIHNLKLLGIDKFTKEEQINLSKIKIGIYGSTTNKSFVLFKANQKFKPFILQTSMILRDRGAMNFKWFYDTINFKYSTFEKIVDNLTPEEFAELLIEKYKELYYKDNITDHLDELFKKDYIEKNKSVIEEILKLAESKDIHYNSLLRIPDILIKAYQAEGETGFNLIVNFFGYDMITMREDYNIHAPIEKFLEWLKLNPKKTEFPLQVMNHFETCYTICPEYINSLNSGDLGVVHDTYDDSGKINKYRTPVTCEDIIKLKKFNIDTSILEKNRGIAKFDIQTLQNLMDKYQDNSLVSHLLDEHTAEILTFGDTNKDWEGVFYKNLNYDFDTNLKVVVRELDKLGYNLTQASLIEPTLVQKYGIFKAMILTYNRGYSQLVQHTGTFTEPVINENSLITEIKKIDKIMESISKSKNYAHIKPYSQEYAKLVILFYTNYNIRGRDPNLLINLFDDFSNSIMTIMAFPSEMPSAAIANFFGTSDLSNIDTHSDKFQLLRLAKSDVSKLNNWLEGSSNAYEEIKEFRNHITKEDFYISDPSKFNLNEIFSSKTNLLEFINDYGYDIGYRKISFVENILVNEKFFYTPMFLNIDIKTYRDKFIYNYFDYIKDVEFVSFKKLNTHENLSEIPENLKSENKSFLLMRNKSYEKLSADDAYRFFSDPKYDIVNLYQSNYEFFLKALKLQDLKPIKIKLPQATINSTSSDLPYRQEVLNYLTNIIQMFGNSTPLALDKFSKEWHKNKSLKPKNYNEIELNTKYQILHDFGNAIPSQQDLINIPGFPQYYLENFSFKNIDDLKLIGVSWNKIIKFFDETNIKKILAEMAIKEAAKLPEYKNNPKLLSEKITLDNMSFLVGELDDHTQYPFLVEFSKYNSATNKDTLRNDFRFLKTIWTEGIKNPLPKFAKFNKTYTEGKDTITMRFLPREDPRGMFLGNIAGCCQHPGGAAASCSFDGTFNKNAAFMVTEINGDLALMAYVWQDENGNVCFDNFETIGNRIFHSQPIQMIIKKLLQDFASSLPQGKRTTYGRGYTKLDLGFQQTNNPLRNKLNFMNNPKYQSMHNFIMNQEPDLDWYNYDSATQNEIPRNQSQQPIQIIKQKTEEEDPYAYLLDPVLDQYYE